jgi:hypothetical protein
VKGDFDMARRITKREIEAVSKKPIQVVEQRIVHNIASQIREQPNVSFRLSESSKGPSLEVNHKDELTGLALLMSALGSCDKDFISGIVGQLISLNTYGDKIDIDKINFMLSIMKGIKPKDQLEAMFAMQIAAIYDTTMMAAKRLSRSETLVEQDSAARIVHKGGRTFAIVLDALIRYRAGGDQKVVQQVSVHEGGQAIVGNITQAPRER